MEWIKKFLSTCKNECFFESMCVVLHGEESGGARATGQNQHSTGERTEREERGEERERDGDMSIYIPSVHIGSNSTRLNSLYMRLSGKREVMEVGSLNI